MKNSTNAFKSIVTGAVLSLALGGVTKASTLPIDGFQTPDVFLASGMVGLEARQTDSGLVGVLGGSRTASITAYGNPSIIRNATLLIGQEAMYDGLSLNGGDGVYFTTYMLYDNSGSGLDVDFRNVNKVSVFLKRGDHLGDEKRSFMSITLTDNSLRTVTADQEWGTPGHPSVDPFTAMTVDFSFNDPAFDFAHVHSIKFLYESDQANDLLVGGITANVVPEPESLLLFGVVGLAMAALKRMRRS